MFGIPIYKLPLSLATGTYNFTAAFGRTMASRTVVFAIATRWEAPHHGKWLERYDREDGAVIGTTWKQKVKPYLPCRQSMMIAGLVAVLVAELGTGAGRFPATPELLSYACAHSGTLVIDAIVLTRCIYKPQPAKDSERRPTKYCIDWINPGKGYSKKRVSFAIAYIVLRVADTIVRNQRRVPNALPFSGTFRVARFGALLTWKVARIPLRIGARLFGRITGAAA